jgi:DDE superfamily endonuclease
LHVALDNSSTHSTPEVNRWLERHKRVYLHFTPTSASWLNIVVIWFSILTRQRVHRGVYHDVPELIARRAFGFHSPAALIALASSNSPTCAPHYPGDTTHGNVKREL